MNRRFYIASFVVLFGCIVPGIRADDASSPDGTEAGSRVIHRGLTRQVSRSSGPVSFTFEENQGQTHERVRYIARLPGYTLFLTEGEVVFVLHPPSFNKEDRDAHISTGTRSRVVRMKFGGGRPEPMVEGIEQVGERSNYFVGNDRRRWITGVPHFSVTRYREIYPGINVVFYSRLRELEFDFEVAPGANPDLIRLQFEGVERIEVDQQDLILRVDGAVLRLRRPSVYQGETTSREEIDSGYEVDQANHEVRFRIAPYDLGRALVIDPVVAYSAALGRVAANLANSRNAVAVDAGGHALVVSTTNAIDFPITNAIQPKCNECSTALTGVDAVVVKLDPSGLTRIYSTYLGGSGQDIGIDIATDASGNAYLTGLTSSTNFPTRNALQPALVGSGPFVQNSFVAKLNQSGSTLVYSTYFGGPDVGGASAIAVDPANNVYLTGVVSGCNIPCPTPFSVSHVTKLNAAGSAREYTVKVPGAASVDIAVDPVGNAYITGYSSWPDLPIVNALQNTVKGFRDPEFGFFWGRDAFVTKIDPSGSKFVYSTYLGGLGMDFGRDSTGYDGGTAIAVDALGNAYVAGYTTSHDFPLVNPTQASCNHCADIPFNTPPDAFVTKLDPLGANLYSSYLGGIGTDSAQSIAVDQMGQVYVAGSTFVGRVHGDFPLVNPSPDGLPWPEQTIPAGSIPFLAKLDTSRSELVYSTYVGGSGYSNRLGTIGVDIDPQGAAYVVSSLQTGASLDIVKVVDVGPPDPPKPPPSATEKCIDIAGGWLVTESFRLACRITAQGMTDTINETLNGSGGMSIAQDLQRCTFSYTTSGSRGDLFVQGIPRNGEIQGDRLTITGPFGAQVRNYLGITLTVNTFEASGTVQNDRIPLTSSGRLAGRFTASGGIPVDLDCTGTSTATLTRASSGKRPVLSIAGTVNAASFQAAGDYSPGMWVSLFGQYLAHRLILSTGGLQTYLEGITVLIIDSRRAYRLAPLQFVAPDRINFLIPPDVATGPAVIVVTNANRLAAGIAVNIQKVAPGLFSANASGRGPAAATFLKVAIDGARTEGFTFDANTREGSRVNVPIDLGPVGQQVFLNLFGTGFRKQSSVTATIGGLAVPVLGAVAQGQFEGLDQAVVGPLPRSLGGREA